MENPGGRDPNLDFLDLLDLADLFPLLIAAVRRNISFLLPHFRV